ncbi:hypothetical protein OMP38_19525 [Cohnella ginsengisoli]|uniref:Uncharacterized protein n=1 Tax=Cohnella ginsengisoli TaxID=425004 RepID=A0A9X4QNV7_9BACL|nr:hypothetical protein [Cohnella ginsengisoli]MDG0792817.1 hypothetical protein [Cohnella ginsengisoli]
MRWGCKVVLAAVLTWFAMLPGVSEAASFTFSAAAKTAYDKMNAATEPALRAKIASQHDALVSLEAKGDQTDEATAALHDRNELQLKTAKQRIKDIDADEIAKLDGQVKAAQVKYKPLFDGYTALNKRIEAARMLKNKDLNAALKLQADIMKVTVQLARDDIRAKQDKLKLAKSAATAKSKRAKEPLESIDGLKTRIQAEKRAASAAKQAGKTLWSSFNAAAKKNAPRDASNALASLLKIAGQINEAKQNQYAFEQKISEAIARASSLAAA